MAHVAAPPRHPWNQNDRLGFALSTFGPLAAVLAGNALIFLSGWNVGGGEYETVPLSPPGRLVGAICVVIYPMWGAARWYAWQTGLSGRRRSRWVAALIVWGLIYLIIAGLTGVTGSAIANVASLALVLVAAWQVRGVSKRAFWLLAPSIAWISFATWLGFAALANA
jgi:tryptophan-rich sensory protein